MRITGLIRILNAVRAQLAAGIAPEEQPRFKQQVLTVVRQVEELCSSQRTTPDKLPAASRNAYYFFKRLDLNNLPVRSPDARPAAGKVKIRNVLSIGEGLAVRMWRDLDLLIGSDSAETNLTLLVKDLNRHVQQIEAICDQYKQTPAQLETPTRQVFCWMKFLTDKDNLARHLMALRVARQASLPFTSKQTPVTLHLTNITGLWRVRRYSNDIEIKASEGFIAADENIWRALMSSVVSVRPGDRALVKEFSRSEEYSGILGEMDSLAEPSHAAKGHFHDLDESFARVNASYFNDAIAKPGLHWSSVLTSRKFGHYQISRDAIMLSATLDSEKVPTFVVDFVMYHELLHKVHGVVWSGSRALVHTPEFKRDERQYKQYEQAEAFITKLAREQHTGVDDEAHPRSMKAAG